ncbi:f-box domain containing protein [Niveomyces insectorum RCEF 264]|uniref:F-box domain containing protein n=1 Tax=Niveomyces insectorum RCEF 264 TaxID=1081102 RepID=A0A167Q769_9HYPO|nr:f-box domain containing protein [Niveomyces insectorum RCEF 264]
MDGSTMPSRPKAKRKLIADEQDGKVGPSMAIPKKFRPVVDNGNDDDLEDAVDARWDDVDSSDAEHGLQLVPSFSEAAKQTDGQHGKMEVFKQKGLYCLEKGRLEDARAAFLKLKLRRSVNASHAHSLFQALVYCSCNIRLRRLFKEAGVPLDSIDPLVQCSCKDFVAAAQTRKTILDIIPGLPNQAFAKNGMLEENAGIAESGFPVSQLKLTAVYDMATAMDCVCGSGRIRCTEPRHFGVLDRLAVVAAKMGRNEEALDVGQYLIYLAPEQPQGYLHVAKAVLAAGGTRARTTPKFAARCIYYHGQHTVRKYGNPSTDTAKVSANIVLFSDRRCRGLSKNWKAFLQHVHLRINKVVLRDNKPRKWKTLPRFFDAVANVQTTGLGIDVRKASSDQLVLRALRHFNTAQDLDVELWENENVGLDRTLASDVYPSLSRCRKLVITCVGQHNQHAFFGILKGTRDSLESLEFHGCGDAAVSFTLPKLVCLKAYDCEWSISYGHTFLVSQNQHHKP